MNLGLGKLVQCHKDLNSILHDLKAISEQTSRFLFPDVYTPPSVDHPMADLFSWNIYDVGYPKGLKNGNFKFF